MTKFIGGHGTSIGGAIVESGTFPWGERPVPADDRAGAVVRRAELVGQLRRVRVPHPDPLRATARRRGDDDAVQRVPVPHGPRDARAADAPARGERGDRRPLPRRPPTGRLGRPTAAPRVAMVRAGSAIPAGGPGRRVLVRCAGGRRGGRPVHRVAAAGEPSREHRRRPDAGDPSGVDDPPAAVRRRRSSPVGSPPTSFASRSGWRTPTTSAPTSTRRSTRRRRPRADGRPRTAPERLDLLQRARSVAIVGMSANPAVPATSSPPTSRGTTDWTVYFVNPRESEIMGQTGVSVARRPAGDARHRRRVPRVRRPAARRRRGHRLRRAGALVPARARTRGPRPPRRARGSTSSRTDASRSSTPASPAACTPPASTPASSTAGGRGWCDVIGAHGR